MDHRERLNDSEESLRIAMEGQQAKLWTALPGLVAAVDLVKQTLSVQPSIQGELRAPDGSITYVNLPLLVDVPVVWPRAGGFAITFPVKVGDEVLVVFSARCIDTWWQSGGVGAPAEPRMHDLSDGFAVLAPTSQPKVLANVQTDGMELRTESRSTYLRLTDGVIYIKGNIVQEGNLLRTGTSTTTGLIMGHSGITVDNAVAVAPTSLTGDIVHTGGHITSLGKIIDGGHTHSGVQPGSGSTGIPN